MTVSFRGPLLLLFATSFVAAALAQSDALHEPAESAPAISSGVRRVQATPLGAVTKFRLMNADTDQPIPAYDPLPATSVINLSTLPTQNLNIEAITEGTVRSLQWKVDQAIRTKNSARWALCGNSGSNFFPCSTGTGNDGILKVNSLAPLTIAGTPFAESNANGAPGVALSISLSLVSGINTPLTKAPVVVKPPSKAPAVVKPPTKAPVQVNPPSKAPVAVAPPSGSPMMSLTLMNADSDTEIGPLVNDAVINLAATPRINIRANVEQLLLVLPGGKIESVQFSTNGVVTRLDGRAPFSYFGNSGSDYAAWTPAAGRYTILAAAYGQPAAAGPIVSMVTVTFEVTTGSQSAPSKAPAIVNVPTKAPAVVKPPTKAPAVVKPPTKAPAVVKPPTKAPAVVRPPTKAPAVVKPPTKSPAVIKPPTKAPAVVKPPTKAPVPVTPPLGSIGMTLIDAQFDMEIGPFVNETVIDLGSISEINIRVDIGTSSGIASVQFRRDGEIERTDNASPFAMFSNNGQDYSGWEPSVGRYLITATGYGQPNAQGPARASVTATLIVIQTRFTLPTPAPVAAPGSVDLTPPQLVRLSINPWYPSFVNIANGPGTAVISLNVQDSQSGLKRAVVRSILGYKQVFEPTTNTGGSLVEFNVTFQFPFGSPLRNYPLTVVLTDNAGNTVTLAPTNLLSMGQPSFVRTTTNVNLLNMTALTPTTIDVSNGPVNVTILFTVQAPSLSLARVFCDESFDDIETIVSFNQPNPELQIFPVTLQFPTFINPGRYFVNVELIDANVKGSLRYGGALFGQGFSHFVDVSNTVLDITAPSLVNFTVKPSTVIDMDTARRNVTVEFAVRDDQSGVVSLSVQAITPKNDVTFAGSRISGELSEVFNPFIPSTRPRVGTTKVSAVFDFGPDFSYLFQGAYSFEVFIQDRERNFQVYKSTDLVANGWPGGFTIV